MQSRAKQSTKVPAKKEQEEDQEEQVQKDEPKRPKLVKLVPPKRGAANKFTPSTGNFLKPKDDYEGWSIDNLIIGDPAEGTSKNGKASFHTGSITYKYSDGSIDLFRIEVPRDKTHIPEATNGIREKMLKVKGKDSTPTGKYHIPTQVSPNAMGATKFIQIMEEIYIKIVKWLAEFGSGKGGKGKFVNKYKCPKKIGVDNMLDNFFHPIVFEKIVKGEGAEAESISDRTKPFWIFPSVQLGKSSFASKFLDVKNNVISHDELADITVKHVPLLEFSDAFHGAKISLRYRVESSVVIDYTMSRNHKQGDTVSEFEDIGTTIDILRAASKALIRESAKSSLDKDSSDDDNKTKSSASSSSEDAEKTEEEKDEEKDDDEGEQKKRKPRGGKREKLGA